MIKVTYWDATGEAQDPVLGEAFAETFEEVTRLLEKIEEGRVTASVEIIK